MFIVLNKSQEESREQLTIVTFSLSDHKQRHIQDPHKHPRRRVLLQLVTGKSHELMLQSAPSSILAGDLEAHLHFLQKQLLDKGTKNYRLEK